MNERVLALLGISAVLGLGSVLGGARWIQSRGQAADSKIVVAARDLPVGTRLSSEHLVLAVRPAVQGEPGVFRDARVLESRVVKVGLAKGAPILEGRLAPPGSKGGLSAVISPGRRAMTVKVNEVIGVAGFALPGSMVDVLLNAKDADAVPVSKILLEQIPVLAVAQEVGRDETKPKVVSAVTLEVTPEQAEKLDLGRSIGTLSLLLRNHGDLVAVATPGMRKGDLLGSGPNPGNAGTQRSGATEVRGGPRTGTHKHTDAASKRGRHGDAHEKRSAEVIRGTTRGTMEVTVFE